MGMFDHLKLPTPPTDRSFGGWFEWKVSAAVAVAAEGLPALAAAGARRPRQVSHTCIPPH